MKKIIILPLLLLLSVFGFAQITMDGGGDVTIQAANDQPDVFFKNGSGTTIAQFCLASDNFNFQNRVGGNIEFFTNGGNTSVLRMNSFGTASFDNFVRLGGNGDGSAWRLGVTGQSIFRGLTRIVGSTDINPSGGGIFEVEGSGGRLTAFDGNEIQTTNQTTGDPISLGINVEGGNVGIGTATPGAKLHVAGTTRIDDWLRIRGNTDGSAWSLGINGPSIYRGSVNVRDSRLEIDQVGHTPTYGNPVVPNGLSLLDETSTVWNIYHSGLFLSFALDGDRKAYIEEDGDYIKDSDARLKANIQDLEQNLDKITALRPVTYKYKNSKSGQTDIGFIAQEVRELFPEAVVTGEDGMLGIAYDHFGVLAIQGLKEQQKIIESLEEDKNTLQTQEQQLQRKVNVLEDKVEELSQLLERISTLESNLQSCCLQHSSNHESHNNDTGATDIFNQERPQLQQNFPNPFNQQTEIQYYLPTTVQTAQIHITDLQGKTLKTYDLSEKGIGKVTLNGGQLASGTYAYTLMIDGKVVDTKQMVLTK